jgi:uncharacterized cupin superfamily protein
MSKLRLPAIDPATLTPRIGSGYPPPFHADCARREKRVLGDPTGITRYGVNLVRLPPGTASAQRHWHTLEEEFVYILEGEVELVTDAGAQTLKAGMAAGFPAGKPDGHHLVNRSSRDALFLEVGDRRGDDVCEYPDIDLRLIPVDGDQVFVHLDGRPWKPGEK